MAVALSIMCSECEESQFASAASTGNRLVSTCLHGTACMFASKFLFLPIPAAWLPSRAEVPNTALDNAELLL